MAALADARPAVPTAADAAALRAVSRMLSNDLDTDVRLVAGDGTAVELPESLRHLFAEIARLLGAGLGVELAPIHPDLTTQEAADLLNVSRPFLVKLLETGDIPFYRVGRHRRIHLGDLLAYRDRRAGDRSAALAEMARDAQAIGLYT